MTEVCLSKFKHSPTNDKRDTTYCQRQINKRQLDQQTNMMTRNQIQRGVPRNNRVTDGFSRGEIGQIHAYKHPSRLFF
jgi:hypothetical protein